MEISPQSTHLEGADRLAAETPRQVANAQAIFNIANMLLFIGFVNPMAWFVLKVLPDKAEEGTGKVKPSYLDKLLLETPSLALDAVRNELGSLGADVLRLTRNSCKAVIKGSREDLDKLKAANEAIGEHHSAVIAYLAKLSQSNIGDPQSKMINRYLSASNYFANVGDMVESSFAEVGYQRLEADLQISDATQEMLFKLHREICRNLDRAIRSLVDRDPDIAAEVIGAKPGIEDLSTEADEHLAKRLTAGEPNRLIAFRLESEIIEYLKRIFYFAKRVAKLAAEDAPAPQRTHSETAGD